MKRLTPNFLLCVVAFLFGVSAGSQSVMGAPGLTLNERKLATFENAPPIPAPVKLMLTSRAPVRVILRVKGLQKEPVTFYLREEPEHGSAKILPQVSREWAELEYTPTQDRRFTTDTFKFVVSNSWGTSSESIADITIKDIGPRLEIPHHLDFGLLQTGEVREIPITVRNTGDIVAEGTISITGDWFLPKNHSKYSLEPGQSLILPLGLAPKRTGVLEGELRFSSGASGSIFLMAKVEDWVHARPDPLLLKIQERNKRTVNLLLSNETEIRQWICIESEPQLSHPYAVWISPKQTLEVTLICDNQTPAEQSGKLILRGSEGRRRIMLWRTAAFGPSLGGLPPGKSLELVPSPNHHLEKRLEIWNQGGRLGRWELKTSDPYKFRLPKQGETNSGIINLAPGESTELWVTLPDKMPSRLNGVLEARLVRPIQITGKEDYAIVLTTKHALQSIPKDQDSIQSPPLVVRPSTPKPEAPHSSESDFPKLMLPDSFEPPSPSLNADVVKTIMGLSRPGAENGIGVSKITSTSVRLSVSAPAQLSIQTLEISSGVATDTPRGFEIVWEPLKKVKIKADPSGNLSVDIGGLTPNSPNNIRIMTPSDSGGTPAFYRQCYITTLPEPHWLSPERPYLWAITGLLLLSGHQRLKQRRYQR
jgi:hypothetical protein